MRVRIGLALPSVAKGSYATTRGAGVCPGSVAARPGPARPGSARPGSARRRTGGGGRWAGLLLLLALLLAPGAVALAQEDSERSGEEAQEVLQLLLKRTTAVQARTADGRTILQAPPFKVLSRLEDLEYYPCDDCHDADQTDHRVRTMEEEHTEIEFDHGGGRFWCYDACHNAPDMTRLQQMWGEAIPFDQSYKLCGQCHFQREKDWYFGAHGKRVGAFPASELIPELAAELRVEERESIGTWRSEERKLLNCTACHNPHSPSIKAFKPSPPPKVRAGLEKQVEEQKLSAAEHKDQHDEHVPIWEALGRGQQAEK